MKTFSIDFPEAGFSEGEHARRVAQIYGTEHEDRVLEPAIVPLVAEAVRYRRRAVRRLLGDPHPAALADDPEQVTVALSGDGGDEAFAGYRALPRWPGSPTGAAPARRRSAAGEERSALAAPARGDRAAPGGDASRMPSSERYASMMSHFTPAELAGALHARVPRGRGRRPAAAWEETLAPPDLPGVDRYLALDTAAPTCRATCCSRSTGCRCRPRSRSRSPFLDYRVHEFAARLPARMKLRGRTTKWALKELARRRGLPDDLVHRRKQGFGVPVGAWMRGELRTWVEDLLLDPAQPRARLLRPRRRARPASRSTSTAAPTTPTGLWNLAMLELWHRSWIDAA